MLNYLLIAIAHLLYAAVFLISTCVRLLGLKALMVLGAGLGHLLRFAGFRKRIVRENLRLAFGKELSPAEIRDLERRVFRHVGRLFLEVLRNFALSQDRVRSEFRIDPESERRIRGILSRGRGMILLSGHFGNWEIGGLGLPAHGIPLSVVAKRMTGPISQVLLEKVRLRARMELIYSGGVMERIRASLKQGRAVAFMIDQNKTGNKAIRVNFFGVPASSIRSLAGLKRETDVPILPVCTRRLDDGTHTLFAMEELPYVSAPDLPEGSVERIYKEEWLNSQLYQDAIEKMVRQQPDQWLWIHRRWKANREPLSPENAYLANIPRDAGTATILNEKSGNFAGSSL